MIANITTWPILTQIQAGKRIDQGRRGVATGGKNFDGFVHNHSRL